MPGKTSVMASIQGQNTTQKSMSSFNEKKSHLVSTATKSTKKAQSSTSTKKAATTTTTDTPSRSTCARPNGLVATSTKTHPSSPVLFPHVETEGQAQRAEEWPTSSPVLSARLENDRQAQKKGRPTRPGRPKKSTKSDLDPCVKGTSVADQWSQRRLQIEEQRSRLHRDLDWLNSQLEKDKKETDAAPQACIEEQPQVPDVQPTTQPSEPLEPHPQQPLLTQTSCDGQSVLQPTEEPVPHSPISAGSSTPALQEQEPEHERSTTEQPSALPTPPLTPPATPTAPETFAALPSEPEFESSQARKAKTESLSQPQSSSDTPPATPPVNGPKNDEEASRHGLDGTPTPPKEEQAAEILDFSITDGCFEMDVEGDCTMGGVPRYRAASFYNSFAVDDEGDIEMLERDPDTSMSDAPPLKNKPQSRERTISIASTIDIPRDDVGVVIDDDENEDDGEWYSKEQQEENYRLHQKELRKYLQVQKERHAALDIPPGYTAKALKRAFVAEQMTVLRKQQDDFWSALSRGEVRPEISIALPIRVLGESHQDFDDRRRVHDERSKKLEREALRSPAYLRSQEKLKTLREKKKVRPAHVVPPAYTEADYYDEAIL